jgi:anti-sigma factor RsiW
METEPPNRLSDDELGDLARLADGTLPPDRRAEVEARVAASPQLSSIVERQGVALSALRATADTGAPERLRAQVERRRVPGRAKTTRRPRFVLGGALAATAVVVLALIAILPGAGSGAPTVADAAGLARNAPSQPAPSAVTGSPLLRENVDDVSFPDYTAKFGWKPVGARQDSVAGRRTRTVYYRKGTRTIAYTIVSGHALDPPSHARSTKRGATEYRTFEAGGRTAVTWERQGHTCVLSGKEVRPGELVTLGDWRGKGAIRF